jgi:hypothetical protein
MAGEIFYYANGQKVPLKVAEDYIAIASGSIKGLLKDSLRLGGVTVVGEKATPPAEFKAIKDNPDARAVYVFGETLMVPLPQVRVEDPRASVLNKAEKWLRTSAKVADKLERDGHGITFLPASGSADDAVKLANEVQKETGAKTAQPNFLRLNPER